MSPALGIARRLASNALRLGRGGTTRSLGRSGGLWLELPISSELDDVGQPRLPFAFGRPAQLGLMDVLRTLDAASHDPRVEGVLLRPQGGGPRWGHALALRRALDALQAAGKRVVAWGEALDAAHLLVATGADRVFLPVSGSVFLVGLATGQVFVRDLLRRFDVEPEVVRIGSFKGAAEPLTRDSMSPEQREQLESWQGDVFETLIDGIARGRGLAPEQVRKLVDEGPFPARAACDARLVDGCLYADELDTELEALARECDEHEGPRKVQRLDATSYFRDFASDAGRQPLSRDLPAIAYVVANGNIHRGPGMRGIGSDGFSSLFEHLGSDRGIRGVVLRVDSGGGDAIASDLLNRAVHLLTHEKPVVVSMGEVAASGGYYIAAAADAIFAEASTLTGSIGVVGGKPNLSGLLRRVGIATESVESGERAGILSMARGFTEGERGALQREMESLYDTFLARVATGRGLARETVARVAEGRVWSGLHARSLGLVDGIGGPLEALTDVLRRAGVGEGERFTLELHPRRPRLPSLTDLLGI